jgi:hypothetical protein
MHQWLIGLGLTAVVGIGAASAAIVRPMNLGSLAHQADIVVLGQVVSSQAVWQGGRIVTQVKLAPETVFKGAATGPIEISVLGGEVDGIAQRVAGATAFVPQERAVVFLRLKGKTHQVVGMAQGKLRVEFDASGVAMVPDLRGLVFATPDANGVMQTKAAAPVRMPLTQFAAELGRALVQP